MDIDRQIMWLFKGSIILVAVAAVFVVALSAWGAPKRYEIKAEGGVCSCKVITPTKTPVGTKTPTPAPTKTPTVAPTATPSPAPTSKPIPELALWESSMTSYGTKHCTTLKGNVSFDEKLAATYYDGSRIFLQIHDYTDDTNWLACADAAHTVYRDQYVIGNNGAVPGYWSFTEGLKLDYLWYGEPISKTAIDFIAKNAAFHGDQTPLSWTVDSTMSREVAYAIEAYLNAEAVGYPRRDRLYDLIDQAFGHYSQWFVTKTAPYVRPFMAGLTAEALIQAHGVIPDSRTLPALKNGADWLWDNCWLPANKAFKYTDRPTDTGGTEPAPDLNLLIAPMYSWLWFQTGDVKYRDRFDEIFAGGIAQSYLTQAKIFNQNYRYSFQGVKWRQQN